MVLDKRNIIEFDSPELLLSNKSSVFYSLAIDEGVKIKNFHIFFSKLNLMNFLLFN